MSQKRISRRNILSAAESIGEDDGLDPRFDRQGGRRLGRKTLQLCGQVMETLTGVLAEQADGVLRELQVVSVTPAGNGRMLVRVKPTTWAAVTDAVVILGQLGEAHGRLRSEVAAAIHRRKAPDLVFAVVTDQ